MVFIVCLLFSIVISDAHESIYNYNTSELQYDAVWAVYNGHLQSKDFHERYFLGINDESNIKLRGMVCYLVLYLKDYDFFCISEESKVGLLFKECIHS